MKKTLVIIAGLSLSIHSINPCTGDGGDWSDYNNYKRKYHDSCPTTIVCHSTVTQRSYPKVKLPISTQPTPTHIASLKLSAEKAIKSDRLPAFKRILLYSDLKKYPDVCQDLFRKIVSHWTHLRNGQAYLIRLEKKAGGLPSLTKKMLAKQLYNGYSGNSYNKLFKQISKHKTFLIHAKNMKIIGKSYSTLEYMQRLAKEGVAMGIAEHKANDGHLSSRSKTLILHLYDCLQIAEDPFESYKA